MNASSPSDEDDANDVVILVRPLTSGLRRHHKKVHLLRVWRQAQVDGDTVVAAAIYTVLSEEMLPKAACRAPFNFNSLSNDECIDKFRFEKYQIVDLVTLLGLDGIRTRERTAATGVEGLRIVLYKFAVPMRWVGPEDVFGRDSSGLSNLFLHVLAYIDGKFDRLLYFNHDYVVQNLQVYADAVFNAGGFIQNVWAFIDGTVRGICRPRPRHIKRDGKFMSQKSVYNGHKRKHALKYQTLTTPDGLIVVLCCPYAGAVGNLSRQQRQVNVSMSRVRVSVEWSYGQVTNYWTALDFKRQARAGVQPVGLMYRVGVFLTNCITCAEGGNTISDYFGLSPPSLKRYL